MGATTLSSRAIIGTFYKRIEEIQGTSWAPLVARMFTSNQESETYPWLGMSPMLREWIGSRQAKGFRENAITIPNKKFEATLEITVDELRRDKTDQIMVRIDELAVRAAEHWDKLLTTLIESGETATCYDGQAFFDTDHAEHDSGTQDNDITSDVTTTTAPTPLELSMAAAAAIGKILGFKDDQGEPYNGAARRFLCMVPHTFFSSAMIAFNAPILTAGTGAITNPLKALGNYSVEWVVNPRLTWTTKFATFRIDSPVTPLIRQEEQGVTIQQIGAGSELEFREDRHQYGVKALRNVAFGLWQHACLTTLV